MARGTHSQTASDYMGYIGTPNIANSVTEYFTICGWRRIVTVIPSENAKINYMSLFIGGTGTNKGLWIGSDITNSTVQPITMEAYAKGNSGGLSQASIASESVDEDWFHAITWDFDSQTATYYKSLAGDPTMFSYTVTPATSPSFNEIRILGPADPADPGGTRCAMTNVKAWKAFLTPAELLIEKNLQIPDKNNNIFAWWRLQSAADNMDYTGNQHHLSINGSLTDGTLNPVDIVSPPSRGFITGLNMTQE